MVIAVVGGGAYPPPDLPSITCVWLGICGVVSVVAPALPDTELIVTEPVGVCEANAVVKFTEPPLTTEPVTMRIALLSSPAVASFVQPVGAAVCWKDILVPDGNDDVATVWNDGKAPAPLDIST